MEHAPGARTKATTDGEQPGRLARVPYRILASWLHRLTRGRDAPEGMRSLVLAIHMALLALAVSALASCFWVDDGLSQGAGGQPGGRLDANVPGAATPLGLDAGRAATPAGWFVSPTREATPVAAPSPSMASRPTPPAAVWPAAPSGSTLQLFSGPATMSTPVPLAEEPAVMPSSAFLPPLGYRVPDLIIDPELEQRVVDALGPELGAYGIMGRRLCDGRGVAINTDAVFYAASLFKLEVLYSVFKQRAEGRLDLEEVLVVTPYHASFDLETLPWAVGSAVSIRDLLEAMITFSDNTSAIVLYDRVGWNTVDRDMKELGLLNSVILEEDLPTTAYDMFLLMDLIARGEAVDREASEEIMALLSRQRINNRLPVLLPAGTVVAHKTGEWLDATHDVGIVFAPQGSYVVAMLSRNPWDIAREAALSALIYEYFEANPCGRAHPELE